MYILTQATDFKYATYMCTVTCELEVEFEGDNITLDIAEEGVVLPDGWKITPCSHPRIILSKPTYKKKLHIHQAECFYVTSNRSKKIRFTTIDLVHVYQLASCT